MIGREILADKSAFFHFHVSSLLVAYLLAIRTNALNLYLETFSYLSPFQPNFQAVSNHGPVVPKILDLERLCTFKKKTWEALARP